MRLDVYQIGSIYFLDGDGDGRWEVSQPLDQAYDVSTGTPLSKSQVSRSFLENKNLDFKTGYLLLPSENLLFQNGNFDQSVVKGFLQPAPPTQSTTGFRMGARLPVLLLGSGLAFVGWQAFRSEPDFQVKPDPVFWIQIKAEAAPGDEGPIDQAELAEAIDVERRLAEFHENMDNCRLALGHWDWLARNAGSTIAEKIHFWEKVLEFARKCGDTRRIGEALEHLGRLNGMQGDVLQAAEDLGAAMSIYQERGNEAGVSRCLEFLRSLSNQTQAKGFQEDDPNILTLDPAPKAKEVQDEGVARPRESLFGLLRRALRRE